MQYIVHACGEVSTEKTRSYAITARTKEEAETIAQRKFGDEFEVDIGSVYASSSANNRTKKLIIASLLMIIAIALSVVPWKYQPDLFGIKIGAKKTLQFYPMFKSTLSSIILYSAYVVRIKGIKQTTENIWDVFMSVLNILLFATMFRLLLENNIVYKFVNTYTILIVTIIFSWLGLKIMSVCGFGIVVLLSLSSMTTAEKAMGFGGAVYLICAFLGVLIWLSAEPSVLEALPAIKNDMKKGLSHIKNDCIDIKRDYIGK